MVELNTIKGENRILFSLGTTVPLTLFGLYLAHHAVNVPYMDDVELVDTINIIKEDSSRFFSVLFRQQNDHRSVFPRLGIITAYLLTGTSDFRTTILLGYANLILLGYTFYLIHQSVSLQKFSFLPVPILLFSPLVFQDHIWSLTAFQHTLSIAFSLLCLYFLDPAKQKYWLISFVFAASAGLTNLDGISVLPIALFWLITQARWRHACIFLAFTVPYLLIYFIDFKFSNASKIHLTLESIPLLIKAVLTITGSFARIISDTKAVLLSLILGIVFILTFTILKVYPGLADRTKRVSPVHLFSFDLVDICCLRMFASMVVIAVGRFADGIGTMVAIRFQVYSVSVAILIYLFILKSLGLAAGRFLINIAISLAITASVYSYVKYDTAINYLTDGLKADTYNYTNNRLFLHQYFDTQDPVPSFYRNYSFPKYISQSTIAAWKSHATNSPAPNLTRVTVKQTQAGEREKTDIYPMVEIQLQNHEPGCPSKGLFLTLISNGGQERNYILAARKLKNGDHLCSMPKKIPQGYYTVLLCWIEKGKPVSRRLTEKIWL